MLNYSNAIYLLISYKVFLSFFFDFKAGILNNPGMRFIAKGYNIEIPKLNNVSLIKCI